MHQIESNSDQDFKFVTLTPIRDYSVSDKKVFIPISNINHIIEQASCSVIHFKNYSAMLVLENLETIAMLINGKADEPMQNETGLSYDLNPIRETFEKIDKEHNPDRYAKYSKRVKVSEEWKDHWTDHKQAILKLLKDSNIKQTVVADKLGISNATVSSWLSDDRILKVDFYKALAEATHMELKNVLPWWM